MGLYSDPAKLAVCSISKVWMYMYMYMYMHY